MIPWDELTNPWVIVGLLGQACFGARFLLQWIVSEKRKESVIPIGFWYLSLGGAAIVLSYAIYRRDPVFVLGQTFGFVVYLRNLTLLRRKKRARTADVARAPAEGAVPVSSIDVPPSRRTRRAVTLPALQDLAAAFSWHSRRCGQLSGA